MTKYSKIFGMNISEKDLNLIFKNQILMKCMKTYNTVDVGGWILGTSIFIGGTIGSILTRKKFVRRVCIMSCTGSVIGMGYVSKRILPKLSE
jgi:hypothetical protein